VRGPDPHFFEVQRPRLGDDVAEVVEEVRASMRTSGHRSAVWWLGPSATPADLPERLAGLGLGAPHDRAGELVALATTTPPEPGPPEVEVRPVGSPEEFAAACAVMWEAFETPPERRVDPADMYRRHRAQPATGAASSSGDRPGPRPAVAGRIARSCVRAGTRRCGAASPPS
jgi:hypothetical protein